MYHAQTMRCQCVSYCSHCIVPITEAVEAVKKKKSSMGMFNGVLIPLESIKKSNMVGQMISCQVNYRTRFMLFESVLWVNISAVDNFSNNEPFL